MCGQGVEGKGGSQRPACCNRAWVSVDTPHGPGRQRTSEACLLTHHIAQAGGGQPVAVQHVEEEDIQRPVQYNATPLGSRHLEAGLDADRGHPEACRLCGLLAATRIGECVVDRWERERNSTV